MPIAISDLVLEVHRCSSVLRRQPSALRTSVDLYVRIIRQVLRHDQTSCSLAELDAMRRDQDLNDGPVLQAVTPRSGPVRVRRVRKQFEEFWYVLLWPQVPYRQGQEFRTRISIPLRCCIVYIEDLQRLNVVDQSCCFNASLIAFIIASRSAAVRIMSRPAMQGGCRSAT